MEPLYKELHAYIRRKLWQVYGEDHIDLKVNETKHLIDTIVTIECEEWRRHS